MLTCKHHTLSGANSTAYQQCQRCRRIIGGVIGHGDAEALIECCRGPERYRRLKRCAVDGELSVIHSAT